MLTTREKDDCLIVDFGVLEDWDSFEIIALKLHELFGATITKNPDGPDARIWLVILDGEQFSLHNNPYGNYLKAKSPQSKLKLQELLPKFAEFLE